MQILPCGIALLALCVDHAAGARQFRFTPNRAQTHVASATIQAAIRTCKCCRSQTDPHDEDYIHDENPSDPCDSNCHPCEPNEVHPDTEHVNGSTTTDDWLREHGEDQYSSDGKGIGSDCNYTRNDSDPCTETEPTPKPKPEKPLEVGAKVAGYTLVGINKKCKNIASGAEVRGSDEEQCRKGCSVSSPCTHMVFYPDLGPLCELVLDEECRMVATEGGRHSRLWKKGD